MAPKRLRALIFFLGLASTLAYGQQRGPGAPSRVPEYLPGEVLVQFSSTVSDAQIAEAFRQGALNLIKHIQTPGMRDHGKIGLTRVATGLPIPAVIQALKGLPGIEFAEPNWIVEHQSESNDPYYVDGLLWGMYGDDLSSPVGPPLTSNAFGSQAEIAWAAGFIGSPEILVGIVDSGIQVSHPDLVDNIWTNPGEIPGNGLDDDGNGYVDDLHGWNVIDDNGVIFDPGYDSHGTHVAGTIGAVGGNGVGVAGVNWKVGLISGKFIGRTGTGSTLDAVQAIDYLVSLKTRKGINLVALNNSWGGGGFSQALLDAISRAAQARILFVAAAGNSGSDNDVSAFYPAGYDTTTSAGYDSVISVASIHNRGEKAGNSSYGRTTVDLGAPGDDVLSTVPNPMPTFTVDGQSYVAGQMENAAAGSAVGGLADGGKALSSDPSWAGKVVLVERGDISFFPKVVNVQNAGGVAVVLYNSYAGGYAGTLGAGNSSSIPVLTLSREVGLALKASGLGRSATVVSPAPGTLGTGYAYKSGTSMATPQVTGAIALYSSIYSGATAPEVKTAILTAGVRPFSALQGITVTEGILDIGTLITASVEPIPVPMAPAGLQAFVISGGRVNLTWTDHSDTELGFAFERSTDGVNFFLADTVGANAVSASDSGVQPGLTYYYRLHAYNAGGASGAAYAPSPVTIPTVTPPAAPSGLTASALARGGVKLAWTDRASNEESYQVERKTGTDAWQFLVNLPANTSVYTDHTAVSRVTYSYRLRAINLAGPSAYSNTAAVKAK